MVNRPGLISTTLEGKSLNSKTQLSSPHIWLVLGTSQQGLFLCCLWLVQTVFLTTASNLGRFWREKERKLGIFRKENWLSAPLMDWIIKLSLAPQILSLQLCRGWRPRKTGPWSTPRDRKGRDEMSSQDVMYQIQAQPRPVSSRGICSALEPRRGATSWWHVGPAEPGVGKRHRSLFRQGLHTPVYAIWFAINCKWLHIVYHRLAQGTLERIMSCSWWQSETTVSLQVWLHILPLVQSSTHHHHHHKAQL